ncbi:hypothetical protein AAMO2058_001107800 [Amorphochlora amoebiformis]
MCLFPSGGGQIALQVVQGSDVDKWRQTLVAVCIGHFVLGLLNIISLNVWDGMFDLLGAGIGYYGSREKERILPTMILCYTVFVIMDCFWACLNSLLLLADVKEVPGPAWRQNLYRGVVYASVFFYFIAIFVSYKVYKLLQRQWNATFGVEEGGIPPYGGGAGMNYGGNYGGGRAVGGAAAGCLLQNTNTHVHAAKLLSVVAGQGFVAPGVVNRPQNNFAMNQNASGARARNNDAFKGQGYRLGDGKRVGT